MYDQSTIQRFKAKIDTSGGPDACWPWTGALSDRGYGLLRIGGRRGKLERANRIALELHLGHSIGDLYALHTCDNPPCCNPKHLYAGTPLRNTHDCFERGRCRTRVTLVEVANVLEMYAGGMRQADIVRDTGFTAGTVSRIVRGERKNIA